MQKRIFVVLVLIMISSLITFVVCLKFFNSKVVYVDNKILFNQFKMTKELQIEGEKMLELKKRELDSLKLLLKSELIKEKSSLLMQHYLVKRQEIDEYQVTFVKYNTEKIWDRISTYTTDFAMLNDYDMIIDADEKKSILYGDKEHDVTLDLLKYINMKYEGYQ